MPDPTNEALTDGVLVVFVPGRHRPGALATALRRHGLQFVEAAPPGALRARYTGREGLWLTLAAFTPAPAARGRQHLPDEVAAALYEIADAERAPVEFALLAGSDDAPRHATLSADALTGALAVGCRYTLDPPAPRVQAVPGRPEVEGWTRRER